MLSIVMPTYNAAAHLPRSLPPLVEGVVAGLVRELIVSDGGSTDATCAIAEAAGAEIVTGASGRGPQLIAGVARARGDWVLFLHADTALAPGWAEVAQAFIAETGAGARAAAFAFAFDDRSRPARRAEFWVGVRCGLLKLPYGDQGLLISRRFYDALGGFKDWPLMEDVDLVRRIGRRRLAILRHKAITSAEKYRAEGYARRAFRNLALLARYSLGADPHTLARAYYRAPPGSSAAS